MDKVRTRYLRSNLNFDRTRTRLGQGHLRSQMEIQTRSQKLRTRQNRNARTFKKLRTRYLRSNMQIERGSDKVPPKPQNGVQMGCLGASLHK